MKDFEKPTVNDAVEDNTRFFINVARGLAIFLMLWGHCIQCCCLGDFDFYENDVFRVIYSFHMPLFMLISGYLFFYSARKRTLRELLIHKTQSLLQPIIMCGILYYFLCTALRELIFGHDLTFFMGGYWINGYFEQYWFLWSVLAASIAVGFSIKITDKNWLKATLLIVGMVFVSMMPCYENNLYMYPFFVAGFLFAKFKDTKILKKINFLKYFSIPLFPVMMFFFKKEHYIYTSGIFGSDGFIENLPNNLYRWAIGFVGSIFVLTLLELIFKFVVLKIKKPILSKGIGKIGEKSLQIYILSIIFLSDYLPDVYGKIKELVGYNVLAQNTILYNFVYTLLLAVAYSFILYFINRVLEKIKVSKILFGK